MFNSDMYSLKNYYSIVIIIKETFIQGAYFSIMYMLKWFLNSSLNIKRLSVLATLDN